MQMDCWVMADGYSREEWKMMNYDTFGLLCVYFFVQRRLSIKGLFSAEFSSLGLIQFDCETVVC